MTNRGIVATLLKAAYLPGDTEEHDRNHCAVSGIAMLKSDMQSKGSPHPRRYIQNRRRG